MIRLLKYCVLIILISFCSEVRAQKYTEGVIEFGVVTIESTTDEPLDSAEVAMIKQALESQLGMTIYFAENRFAFQKVSLFGDTTRGVYDLESGKFYEFKEIGGEPSFFTEDVPEGLLNFEGDNFIDSLGLEDRGILEEKLFGLECREYALEQEGSKVSVIVTNDINLVDALKMNPISADYGSLVRMAIIDQRGVKMVLGTKSFVPVISDESMISIDTTGLVNKNRLRKAFQDVLGEETEEEEKNEKH